MWIYLNLFAISDGIRRKTKIYEQFQVETEKKSIFRPVSVDWESKNGKVIPLAEKQLSYPEQAYKYCRFVEGIKEDG